MEEALEQPRYNEYHFSAHFILWFLSLLVQIWEKVRKSFEWNKFMKYIKQSEKFTKLKWSAKQCRWSEEKVCMEKIIFLWMSYRASTSWHMANRLFAMGWSSATWQIGCLPCLDQWTHDKGPVSSRYVDTANGRPLPGPTCQPFPVCPRSGTRKSSLSPTDSLTAGAVVRYLGPPVSALSWAV